MIKTYIGVFLLFENGVTVEAMENLAKEIAQIPQIVGLVQGLEKTKPEGVRYKASTGDSLNIYWPLLNKNITPHFAWELSGHLSETVKSNSDYPVIKITFQKSELDLPEYRKLFPDDK